MQVFLVKLRSGCLPNVGTIWIKCGHKSTYLLTQSVLTDDAEREHICCEIQRSLTTFHKSAVVE